LPGLQGTPASANQISSFEGGAQNMNPMGTTENKQQSSDGSSLSSGGLSNPTPTNKVRFNNPSKQAVTSNMQNLQPNNQ
jgi:hypothetical protein